DSPWGRGRPGWHIECSAMIAEHLGATIDIHGGGNDLKFPHHENELAQSSCAHGGAPLARYWVHNGFVQIDDTKMSKSIGNVLLVDDLLEDHPGEAVRYALLMSRYREPLNWSDALIGEARASLDHLYGALKRLAGVNATAASSSDFDAVLDDDLNTAEALALLRQTARRANVCEDPAEQRRLKGELLGAGLQLGILQQDPSAWFSAGASLDEGYIRGQIEARELARGRRDFSEADRIRDELAAAGIQLLDGPNGTEWRAAD
ncbi:MAG: class I tRNA ligase family protein, partial [Gammaproteobacteria bacterium]|nr:class I tRNA ligase family protein [Gammaproteobacteria bacterium]